MNTLSYDISKLVVRLVASTYFRVRITYLGRVPATGGFILAPVHRSHLDPPLTSLTTKRRLHFLAKRSLFSGKISGAYLRSLGAFPITRGAPDLGAFKQSLAILKSGKGLVVFPEGTRQPVGSNVGELEEGTCKLAQRADVPVIPVAIFGSGQAFGSGMRLPKPVKINMIIGKPIAASDVTTELLHQQLSKLLNHTTTIEG